MITIRKKEHTLQVSEDTFNSMFKRMGYEIVNKKAEVSKETSANNKNNSSKKTENKKIDNLSKDVDNLSVSNKKDVKNVSKENKEVSKEDSKENKIEDILDILSETSKEDKKTK